MRSLRVAIQAYVDRGSDEDPRRLVLSVRILVLLLGAIRAWSSRNLNNPAGISYLDIADAYMRGDFANAVNGYFSPLYSLLLGPVLAILRPGPAHEAAVVHLVNFFIYGAAMWAFDRFLRAVIDRAAHDRGRSIPQWAWILFGYAVFTWSALTLIGVADVSADLLMAVFVYASAAILVRMQDRRVSLLTGAALGLMLGLGYLAKAAMLPLSFVFFAVALGSRRQWRLNVPVVATALLAFSIVTAPFVAALSIQKGRLTTGDIGKLVYAWFVNGVTMYAHWQGEPPGRGTPVHPDRKIHDQPQVFEYATPVSGTLPVFYDPSYWYEGLETQIDARKQVRALLEAGQVSGHVILDSSAEWLAIGVLLAWGSWRRTLALVARQWFIFVPATVPFVMFAIVHTETRFIGAFVVMMMMALLLAVRVPDGIDSRRVAATLMVAVTIVVSLRIAVSAVEDVAGRGVPGANPDYDVAVGLQTMGARAGDRIGMVGRAYDAYWARLARLRFVAELPQSDAPDFWSQTPERRASVYDAFRRAGARWIVSEWIPRTPTADGWEAIGATGFYAYKLDAVQ